MGDGGEVIFGFGIAYRASNCGPANGKKLWMMDYGCEVILGFSVAYVYIVYMESEWILERTFCRKSRCHH